MPESDDIALLKEYSESGSEAAFTALVERHADLVYSAALRSAGSPHAAQEISQAVFVILARKAKSLGDRTILSGWLYQTARLTAANYLRGEIRRQHREQEAYMQTILNEPESVEAWRQIAPLLDDAMDRLGEKDRNAIVLRFFENKNLSEVGVALGSSEDAAKMRVNRALEKLRKFFTKRGVIHSAAIIAGAVSAHSVQAAPVGLAKAVTAVAVAKGATASTSILTLVKGALKTMVWTKAKTISAASLGLLLTAATTGTFVAMRADNPPREPTYQNKSLLQWIAAEPSSPWRIIDNEDIVTYRRTALLAMGRPAVRYLHWVVVHPQQTLEDNPGPRSKRANFMNVVVALELIGPAARAAAPDLVRLWESEASKGNPMYANYNGFPLALAALGDASPEILDALHRHFNSPFPQHGAFCAFAAWRLNPNDSDAISFLRRVLTANDTGDYTHDFTRYSLLDNFWEYTTNSTPFLPEIRNLIDASTNAKPDLQRFAADAAWHILHRMDTANALIRLLAAEACKTNATVDDVNGFAAAALDLSQVPGVAEYSIPVLGELGRYKDASAASFATNIMNRIKTIAQAEVASPH